jgi:peptidoglycan hydrolase-like protein with peptidoglycan-binding domain
VLHFLGRHPRVIGGMAGFGVVFSFVAANALWYQPRHHPAPLLATRMFETIASNKTAASSAGAVDDDPNVTVFRIERQSDIPEAAPKAADKPAASPLVRDIQRALASRGLYNGPADGLGGPKTVSAILFYQETEGMAETGEVNQALLDHLRAANAAVAVVPDERPSMDTTASTRKTDDIAAVIDASEAIPVVAIPQPKPVSPAVVIRIQKALVGMAYRGVKVDGVAGEATRAAIRAFEKSYRMPVTGEPSEALLKKLKSIGAA